MTDDEQVGSGSPSFISWLLLGCPWSPRSSPPFDVTLRIGGSAPQPRVGPGEPASAFADLPCPISQARVCSHHIACGVGL